MKIYISGRQFGKTSMLIKESAKTGATIAVLNYGMIDEVKFLARYLNLNIPEPVTYSEVMKSYWHNRPTRYLIDEAQMFFDQLNVDIATADINNVDVLHHCTMLEKK